jgi:hypothetical protein
LSFADFVVNVAAQLQRPKYKEQSSKAKDQRPKTNVLRALSSRRALG